MFGKVKTNSKGLFDKAWAGLDKYVGEPMNKVAGKMGIEGVWPTTMDRECDKAARILRVFTLDGGPSVAPLNYQDPDAQKKTQKVIKRIPAAALQQAEGLAIFTVFRSGLGFSAASGSGIVIAKKPDGTWGLPSGLLVHTVGFGFMVGIDVYDVVLILRTKTAVSSFATPKVNLGGEVTLVAGPLAASAMADGGYKQAPVWSYVKSKGFYAGVQLDGTIIIERQDENARFYQTRASAATILEGKVKIHTPLDVEGLLQTIEAASDPDRRREHETDAIPSGPAPSEVANAAEVHQPTEGFGAPPSYDDMETIKVKCSDCGTAMTMDELAIHSCADTKVTSSAPLEARRMVPEIPGRNTTTALDVESVIDPQVSLPTELDPPEGDAITMVDMDDIPLEESSKGEDKAEIVQHNEMGDTTATASSPRALP